MYIAIVYGVIALVAFGIFITPVFADWKDLTLKDFRNYFVFAFAIGLLWPFILVLLIVLTASNAYYSRKRKSCDEIEECED